MRKTISKKTRELVYKKYDGHCAYCGCEMEIGEMQIDHLNPVYLAERDGEKPDDGIENLMPACRQCNFYKSTFLLNTFRKSLTDTLLPNITGTFQFRLAEKYGLVEAKPHRIKFYFEVIDGTENT